MPYGKITYYSKKDQNKTFFALFLDKNATKMMFLLTLISVKSARRKEFVLKGLQGLILTRKEQMDSSNTQTQRNGNDLHL